MTRKHCTYPWACWPPASQLRLFKFILLGTAGLCFSVFVGATLFTGTLGQEIAAEKEQYGLVVPLVREINTLRAAQGDLVRQSPEEAVGRILDDRSLNDYVTSLHSTRVAGDQEGVQVTLSGLTLIMLTDFLQDVRDRASLQAPEFVLTRNPEEPRLADVHLVLAR
jgi:type II secretory pathway component PulM